MTNPFTPEFLAIDMAQVANAIKTDGYFSMTHALSDEWLSAIRADVAAHPFAINHNGIHAVHADGQYYLTHMLAASKAFFQYVTHAAIFKVCDQILGGPYRLKAMRYYETYGRHHMQWHTDNKTDRGFAHIPGLIFICYIEDVTDGEFQYVRGSQNWSGDKAYSDYSHEFIVQNHASDIVSFKGPKGTIVIYDTYGIHRAQPVKDSRFVRKSLFFQIDRNVSSGEPVLLNTAFMPTESVTPHMLQYLGFGMPSEYSVYPDTNIRNLPISRLNFMYLMSWVAYRMSRSLYDRLPLSFRNSLRHRLGKSKI